MKKQTTTKKLAISNTKIKLILDISLFLIFLVVYQEKATGITWHEWLGVGITAVIITHVLLNWQWIVSVSKRFFRKLKAEPRINYIVNLGIFIGFTTIIFSGLMMSRSVLPFLGLEASSSHFWETLHKTASDIVVWLTALHVALHWRWIVNAVKRYVIAPVGQRIRPSGQPKPKAGLTSS
jgi:cytochrome b